MSLTALGLSKRFGRRTVLHDLSLRVEPGEVVGLLGPNGAGKTTTFRILAGLLRADAGEVRLDGVELGRKPLWRRARLGLGYLPQRPTVFRRLTVAENVAAALEDPRDPRLHALLESFGLAALADARGAELSGGERRRVEIARALARRPRVLLVDEPFAALDPKTASSVAGHLRRLAEEGVGVLLTDHDARQTLVAADRVYILDRGVLLLEGAPGEVAADPRAHAAYLGEGFATDIRAEGTAWRST